MLTAATSSSIDVAAKPFSRTAASATSRMRSRVSVPLRCESSWTASVIRKRLYHESSRPGRSTLLLPPGRILLPSNPLERRALSHFWAPAPWVYWKRIASRSMYSTRGCNAHHGTWRQKMAKTQGAKYRHRLPQLDGRKFLTDGGIETCLIFHEGWNLPHGRSLRSAGKRARTKRLARIFRSL